jgi:thiol-disulfide isomerase/thioredoxin
MSTLSTNDTIRPRGGIGTRVTVLASLCLLAGLAAVGLGAWGPGTPFPSLTASQLEGQLPNLKGKVVLVDFWASWCTPCMASFPALDALSRKYNARGLVVLGVNVDDKSRDMQRFLEKHPASFAIVRDAAHTLVAAADVSSLPASYLVDRQGRIRYVHSGFHGDKTVEEYVKEIETLLNENEAGKP